jgi:hypothetical protein
VPMERELAGRGLDGRRRIVERTYDINGLFASESPGDTDAHKQNDKSDSAVERILQVKERRG